MEDVNIKIDKKVLEKVSSLTQELFSLVGIEVAAKVTHDKENDAVLVDLASDDSAGLLIGRRGETISALQYILGMMLRKNLGGWVRVIINVGDYREKQEDQLTDLAMSAAERARETREPQLLYNLNPSQRRVVHVALSKEEDLETMSEGEGKDRHLVITLKKK